MRISITADVKLETKLKRVVIRTVKNALKLHGKNGHVSVLITSDEIIKGLNSKFRGIDEPTDVLSFPSGEQKFLGDFAISMDRANKQAESFGHSVEREIAFLSAHATLHLLGFDHEDEEGETAMRQGQRRILKKTGYDIK